VTPSRKTPKVYYWFRLMSTPSWCDDTKPYDAANDLTQRIPNLLLEVVLDPTSLEVVAGFQLDHLPPVANVPQGPDPFVNLVRGAAGRDNLHDTRPVDGR
jgi:hypothetical protein